MRVHGLHVRRRMSVPPRMGPTQNPTPYAQEMELTAAFRCDAVVCSRIVAVTRPPTPLKRPPRHRASSACASEVAQPKTSSETADPHNSVAMHTLRPMRSLSAPQKMEAGTEVKLKADVSKPAHVPTSSTPTHSLTMNGAIGKSTAITIGSARLTASRMTIASHGNGGSAAAASGVGPRSAGAHMSTHEPDGPGTVASRVRLCACGLLASSTNVHVFHARAQDRATTEARRGARAPVSPMTRRRRVMTKARAFDTDAAPGKRL